MLPTYRELQRTMRILKAQDKTNIALTSSYTKLMKEFERVNAEVEVSVETGDEPTEIETETDTDRLEVGDLAVEVTPLPDGLWERMIALVPSRPTAELFQRNCNLVGMTVVIPTNPDTPIRGVRLQLAIYSRSMESLLRKRTFMLEAAYFQLTGNVSTIEFISPNPWTPSTKSSPNPTAPGCTRSSLPPSDSPNTKPNAVSSIYPSKCPTFAKAQVSTASFPPKSKTPYRGSIPSATWR
jgi:hypothetical protein